MAAVRLFSARRPLTGLMAAAMLSVMLLHLELEGRIAAMPGNRFQRLLDN